MLRIVAHIYERVSLISDLRKILNLNQSKIKARLVIQLACMFHTKLPYPNYLNIFLLYLSFSFNDASQFSFEFVVALRSSSADEIFSFLKLLFVFNLKCSRSFLY